VDLRIGRERFADRLEAGRALAALLDRYSGRDDVLVLGLPRGGVPVAAEVAAGLTAELDLLLVRKLGVPGQPELAMGAIAEVSDSVEVVTNDAVVTGLRIPPVDFDTVYRAECTELRRRSIAYRGDRPAQQVAGNIVIVVDDGLATGSTMRAAVAAVQRHRPARLIAAVPVGAADSCQKLAGLVDEVVCALMPAPFHAVRQGYRDFRQTSDDEVLAIMGRFRTG
jgi:putative phosphoribosyl transferase